MARIHGTRGRSAGAGACPCVGWEPAGVRIRPWDPGQALCIAPALVEGRELKSEEIRPNHYRALGQLVARLHHHAARWQPPACPSKRKYDCEGLFGAADEKGAPASEAWSLLPPEYVQPFEIAAGKTRQLMEAWGQGSEVYGLIHGDLGLEANVIF
jgi:Ser/Thr protein kinase RdoA (MazF antagonist)